MTNRDLSERLSELADELDFLADGDQSNVEYRRRLREAADKLHDLSNDTFTPGSTSWKDLKPVGKRSKKQPYINKQGREVPF